jgi:hypothetical protein
LSLWCSIFASARQAAARSFISSFDMTSNLPPAKSFPALPSVASEPGGKTPFGVNEIRLSAGQWMAAAVILSTLLVSVPLVWQRVERFATGPDYRIPYDLSKDYWLYARRIKQVASPQKVILLGDSVVWGEYVLPDGTLSHYLNKETGAADHFINGGLNGLFPLAEEGLVKYYSSALRGEKIIVQCNMLWLTSPKADLSSQREEQFNHARLVPQFVPSIPCYKAGMNERLSAIIERKVNFLGWVNHLQDAYFGQKSILRWTLQEDGGEPPVYPNAWKNPFSQITFRVPEPPINDPQRGPKSSRHKPWSTTGNGNARFEWVDLPDSLQWRAFQNVIHTLQNRGHDVLVILGPFNEHIMAEENLAAYRKVRDGMASWLRENRIPFVQPETLPSLLYADTSHPLTEGYELLAKRLLQDNTFQAWYLATNQFAGN